MAFIWKQILDIRWSRTNQHNLISRLKEIFEYLRVAIPFLCYFCSDWERWFKGNFPSYDSLKKSEIIGKISDVCEY